MDGYYGKIFLTTKRIIFKSLEFGNQSTLDYRSINDITSKEACGNSGSKLKIKASDNSVFNLLVNDPKDWIYNINKLRKNTSPE